MQDFLPVGLAMFKRVRQGGATKIAEAFTDSKDPLQELREEGEPAAKSFRESLDKLSPGLGNPVVSVKVDVENPVPTSDDLVVDDDLEKVLTRIENRLNQLEDEIASESSLNPQNQ